MVHQYKLGGYNIVLDVCSGAVHAVDEIAYDIIGMFEGAEREAVLAAMEEKYPHIGREDMAECYAQVEGLKAAGKLFAPDTFEPMAGRLKQKTAGVVLLAAFGDDQIPVDTHVLRVSNRIGLVKANTPEKTELQLREILPKDIWSHAHHLIIWHGRRCCAARKPACERCPLTDLCDEFTQGAAE